VVSVTVCVGSSCHIKGAREIISSFNQLIRENGLESKIELKGSFCMERCGEGFNWQIDDLPLTSLTIEDAVKTFKDKIIDPIKKGSY
jgi:NADH:ubiquinone oxidoreductase subunit E